jgi:hypothetical protein
MPLVTTGPCNWPDTASTCCEGWDDYDPALQARALDYAKTILWAATGRQFGLCEMVVRPCSQLYGNNFPGGWFWDGLGTWTPYIWNGNWYNCWCNCNGGPGCNCDPACQVYLPGPVYSITSVQVDGASLAPTGDTGVWNYFVLDQQWLVRVDTEACWPRCSDQSLPPGSVDAFEVTYLRGKAVPGPLADAMGTLACEFAKACVGAICRLPARIVSVARQGVNISMPSVDDMLKMGLTGLWEVDQLIASYNPYGLKGRTRFYSPDMPEGRRITYP